MAFFKCILFILILLPFGCLATLEERVKKLEDRAVSDQNQVNELRKENKYLKTEIADLKAEDEKNKQRISELERGNSKTEIAALKTDRDKDRQRIIKLESDNESMRSQLEEARQEIQALNDNLASLLESSEQMVANMTTCCSNNNNNVVTTTSIPLTTSLIDTSHQFDLLNLTIDAHTKAVGSLTLTRDEKYLISTSQDDVKVWDLSAKGKLVKTIANLNLEIKESNDGTKLFGLYNNGDLYIWHVPTFELEIKFKLGVSFMYGLVPMKNNNHEVIVTSAGIIRVVSLATGRFVRNFETGHSTTNIRILMFDPKGRLLSYAKNEMFLWNVETGVPVRQLTSPTGVYAMIIDPTTGYLIIGQTDGKIQIMDMDKNEIIHQLVGHSGAVSILAFRPSDNLLVSIGAEHHIRFWRHDTWENTKVVEFSSSVYWMNGLITKKDLLITGTYYSHNHPGKIIIQPVSLLL